MRTNQAGIDLIKASESCRLKTYRDSKGVPTIGWGHTGPEVKIGMVWTQAQADAQFILDLAGAEDVVKRLVKAQLNENQFSALVSFVFNFGETKFNGSTLHKMVDKNDFAGAAKQFGRWIYTEINGVPTIEKGLVTRRGKEAQLFQTPAQPAS